MPWDFAIQARGHHNTEKLGDDCKLWLEKHVLEKDHFWPARSDSKITLDADGVPELHLTPASPERIKNLQVYMCLKTANNIARVWSDVTSVRKGPPESSSQRSRLQGLRSELRHGIVGIAKDNDRAALLGRTCAVQLLLHGH